MLRFQWKALCVAFEVLALAGLGVLLAIVATAIDAWRSLRGVPRAFGRSRVSLGITPRFRKHFIDGQFRGLY